MSETPTRLLLNKKFTDTEVKDEKLQYIFDKNHHAKILLHNLILMQESGIDDLCDVVIISEENEEFHFHGPILTALSDTQQQIPAKSNEPFASDVIQCLWDYAYKSTVILNAAIINDVKELAARYGLEHMRKACEELEEEDFEEDGADVVMEFEGLPAKMLDGLNNQLQHQRSCSTIIKGSNLILGLPCHSAVLAAASAEFHEKLSQGNKRELRVTDQVFLVITPLVQYIYTAEINLDGETVLPLFETALDYSIPSMVQACCSWLQDALKVDNALGIMWMTQTKMVEAKDKGVPGQSSNTFLENLFRSTRSFVLENFLKIKDQDEFLELTHEDLIDLISDDDLVLDSEEDVFHAMMRWVEHNKEIQELPNLLKTIRLEHCSVDFLESLLNHDLIQSNPDCILVINEALSTMQDDQHRPLYYDQVQQYLKEQELYRFDQETSCDPLEFAPPEFEICNEEPTDDQPSKNKKSATKKKTAVDMRLKRNRKALLERGKNIDGTPDMRLKENCEARVPEVVRKLSFTEDTPRRKDGKPDMRFKVNKEPKKEKKGTTVDDIPRRKDGKPDMRFKVNKNPNKENSRSSASGTPKKADATVPLKKNGTPDMRFAVNKQHAGSTPNKKSSSVPLKNNGTPDMRFAVNKQQSSSGGPSKDAPGPVKKDGTPDMRFAVNKQRTDRTSMSNDNSSISSRNTSTSSSNASLSSLSSSASGPLKKDGTLDMRYSSNKSAYGSGSSCSTNSGSSSASTSGYFGGFSGVSLSSPLASGPLKKDGTPDMRYSRNKSASSSSSSSYGGSSSSSSSGYPGGSSSYTPSGPLKKNGTPDMRYSSNKSGSSYSGYGGSSYSSPSYGGSSSSSSRGYSGGSSSSYSPSGPLKSDGTPDMRYSANRR